MNKGLLFWLCLLVLFSSLMSVALAAGRVALVIGNANYPDARTPLPTTIIDARTLADEFRRIDFDVDFKENLNKQNMQNA
ncbi:MAG: caspase family protein, partial [Pseudolabrys sp.]